MTHLTRRFFFSLCVLSGAVLLAVVIGRWLGARVRVFYSTSGAAAFGVWVDDTWRLFNPAWTTENVFRDLVLASLPSRLSEFRRGDVVDYKETPTDDQVQYLMWASIIFNFPEEVLKHRTTEAAFRNIPSVSLPDIGWDQPRVRKVHSGGFCDIDGGMTGPVNQIRERYKRCEDD